MKRFAAALSAFAIVAAVFFSFTTEARAEEKMVGVISKISVHGAEATVVLKDVKTEKAVTITVNDSLTIEKLKDKRIVEGDEIRLKYDTKDGKNVSKFFRKTAGC